MKKHFSVLDIVFDFILFYEYIGGTESNDNENIIEIRKKFFGNAFILSCKNSKDGNTDETKSENENVM